MPDLVLGVSTWCFNHLLPLEPRAALDGEAPFLPEHAAPIRAYFDELAGAILDSEVRAVELWYSTLLREEIVWEQLQRLAAAGRIASMHAPFGPEMDLSSLDDDIRRTGVRACVSAAALLAELGGQILVVHGGAGEEEPSRMTEHITRSAAGIAEIADRCLELDLEVAVELLPRAGTVGCGGPELLTLLELVNRQNVGVCIDVNHVFPPGRLLPTVNLLGPHLLTTHMSDYDGVSELHRLPGRGIIDWTALIKMLRRVEYIGPFMVEARFEASDVAQAVSIIEESYRKLMAAAEKASPAL